MRKCLVIIPARGGSKGIVDKNIKQLASKPLLYYTIDIARKITNDENICLTTDSKKIKNLAKMYDLDVPFLRPKILSNDTASMFSVLIHAVNHYESLGIYYESILLLQPTSPFRTIDDVNSAFELFSSSLDMVVSVVRSKVSPLYNLFLENSQGFLKPFNSENLAERRQDSASFYSYNGAIYLINIKALKKYSSLGEFVKVKKIEMDCISSIDIDSIDDWNYAEFLIANKKVVL